MFLWCTKQTPAYGECRHAAFLPDQQGSGCSANWDESPLWAQPGIVSVPHQVSCTRYCTTSLHFSLSCFSQDGVSCLWPSGMGSSCTHWWSCAAGHWCQCRYSPCLHGCQPAHLPPAPNGWTFPSGSLPSLNVNFCSFDFHLHLTYVAFIPGDRHQWHQ